MALQRISILRSMPKTANVLSSSSKVVAHIAVDAFGCRTFRERGAEIGLKRPKAVSASLPASIDF
jgi:hypothetical protein